MASDQNSGIEVTYTFSHDDYLHFIDFWLQLNRRLYVRQTARVFFLLLAGYVALFLLAQMPVGFAIGLSTFLAIVCTGLIHLARRRRMRRVKEHSLGERTTRISPDGIFGRFPEFEILNYWKGISRIEENENYLFFFTGGARAHVVPKRAFANADDQKQFRDAASAYWTATRSQGMNAAESGSHNLRL